MSKNIFDYEQNSKEDINTEQQKSVEDMIDYYQKFSQDDLVKELFKVASSEKEKGNLTREKLEEIKNTILPYLNQNQIDFFEKLIEKLNV